jgi:hypothetical protein
LTEVLVKPWKFPAIRYKPKPSIIERHHSADGQAFNSLGNIFRLFTESTMSYHQLDLFGLDSLKEPYNPPEQSS